MKNLILFIPLFLCVACGGIHARPVVGPNGNDAYSMLCSGFTRTMDQCLVKASELCSQGFSIVKAETYKLEYADSGDGFYMPPREYLGVECNSV